MSQNNVINVPEQSKNVFIAVADGTTTEKLAGKIDINRFSNAAGWILWLYHEYKANNNSQLSENFIHIQKCQYSLIFWLKEAKREIEINIK